MEVSFNELEQRILRFLKDEFLEKGSGPTDMHAPATMHRDVMEEFGLDLARYREVIARLEHYGIVQFNPAAIQASNGHLRINAMIVEIVRQLDEQAEQVTPEDEPPNRMDQVKRYFHGKWWFVVLVIGLIAITAIVTFISNLKTILQWFGVRP